MEGKNVLTQKQEDFIINYLQCKNETQAAIQAGYSVKTASAQASRLLKNVKVIQRRQELMRQIGGPAIADIGERKARLTQFQREDIADRYGIPIRTSNIQAIAELNKMEGLGNTLILLDPVRIAQAVDEMRKSTIPEFLDALQSKSSQKNEETNGLLLPDSGTEIKKEG